MTFAFWRSKPRPVASIDEDATVRHIKQKFSEAKIVTDPFPYLLIDGILPDDVYREMEYALPSKPEWNKSQKKDKDLREPFFSIVPGGETFAGLEQHATVWQAHFAGIVNIIEDCCTEVFAPLIEQYLSVLQRTGIVSTRPPIIPQFRQFCQRSTRFAIAPHTHGTEQIIISMLYFPERDSAESQGTLFWRFKGDETAPIHELARYFKPQEIELASTMPFRPNTLVSMLNTPRAVHSVPTEHSITTRRYIFSNTGIDLGAVNKEACKNATLGDFKLSLQS